MNVHVLVDKTFFATSVPIGDGQRLLPVPPSRGLHVGDAIFLRDASGELTWVGNVLAAGETASTAAWSDEDDDRRRHAIVGYLARIHPEVVPRGTSKLTARWVTLNKRTLPTTLPWWDSHGLVYHSTLRIVEGIFTPDQIQRAASRGYLSKHPSGHWAVPHGEARKRIMVEILGVELACGLCGGPIERIESATQDHIIPISQGGPDTLANVQLAHRACNELKGNALPEQYPPFFPKPGERAAGWYGRSERSTRGRRGRGGRSQADSRVAGAGFQVEARELPAAEPKRQPEARAQRADAKDKATDKSGGKSDKAADKVADKATDKPGEAALPATEARKAAKASGSSKKAAVGKPAAQADPRENGVAGDPKPPTFETPAPTDAEEQAWLAQVRGAGLEQLQQYAKQPNWAARTASLRTLEQLPRARAGKARAQGELLAEASGPKGRFQLLLWEDKYILVEERGRRQTVHLVQMCRAVGPEAYVSYLTRFGRTSPLAVVLALLPLWHKGSPDEAGCLPIVKGNVELVIAVADDRIVQCAQEPATVALPESVLTNNGSAAK